MFVSLQVAMISDQRRPRGSAGRVRWGGGGGEVSATGIPWDGTSAGAGFLDVTAGRPFTFLGAF